METPHHAAPARLSIGRALRSHLLLIVVAGLLGAGLAAAASLLLPRAYTATAGVLVRPLDGNAFSPDAQGSDLTNLQTEAQIVTSDTILDQVTENLPDDAGRPNLTRGVTVVVEPNTQILRITYRHARPVTARAVSAALAESYLDYRLERRDNYVDARRTSLETRIDAVNEELKKLRRENTAVDDPAMRSVAGQLLNLRLQLATLESAESEPGEVISLGGAKRTGLAVSLPMAALGGLLVGLAVGCALALLRERRVEILRTVDSIERLGAPVLGHVKGAAPGETTPSDAALMVGAVLRRRLTRPAVVAVSTLQDPDEAGRFVTDLAAALAQGRQSVLLVDAHSSAATPEAGLSEVLADPASLPTVVRRSPDGYARLGVGKQPDTGQRWYATARMDETLQVATESHDWVLVHGAGLDHTLGRSVVAACPHWIPVVVLDRTTRDDFERGLAWADTTGTQALGVVAVDVSRTHRRGDRSGSTTAVDV